MSNENGQSPEDEWVIVPNFPNIRIQVDYENKTWKGAEENGKYVRKKDFTYEIYRAIEDLINTHPLPFHHFEPPRKEGG